MDGLLANAGGVPTTVDAALTALETAAEALHDLNFETLSNLERVTVLQRLETDLANLGAVPASAGRFARARGEFA